MFMIRVEFPNLTFGLEVDIERVPNAKFIPLGIPRCCRCIGATSLSIAILPNSKTNSCKTGFRKTSLRKTASGKTASGKTTFRARLSTCHVFGHLFRLDPSVASL